MEVFLKFLSILLIVFLQGCVVVYDKTNDPIANSVVGSLYKTAKDGFLYEARCADIDSKVQSTEWCVGIQAFDSGNELFKTPPGYNDYVASKEMWDKELFTKLAFEKQRSIITPLKEGTTIEINRMVAYPWGSNGYYWALRAVIISGEHKGKEVELPTNYVLAFPTWLIENDVRKPPVFDQEYLVACLEKECT
jgi:hypothetical protein